MDQTGALILQIGPRFRWLKYRQNEKGLPWLAQARGDKRPSDKDPNRLVTLNDVKGYGPTPLKAVENLMANILKTESVKVS